MTADERCPVHGCVLVRHASGTIDGKPWCWPCWQEAARLADVAGATISVTFTGGPTKVRAEARAFGGVEPTACACGEPIDLELDVTQTVRYLRGRIIGCESCGLTGASAARGTGRPF